MTLRLFALTCGYLTGNLDYLMEGGEGQVDLPIPSYLIEHPRGTVLFDTGMHPDCQRDSACSAAISARRSWCRRDAGILTQFVAAFRIASPEMFPEAEMLPHLICSQPMFIGGAKDEADQHGGT